MHRHITFTFLALLAVGLALTGPALADDEASLQEQVRQLRDKIDALQAQSATSLEEEVDAYLDESAAWKGAQGGGALAGITIGASFTSVLQATVGLDQADRAVVNGDVDLDFDFQVTDNLDLFIHLTANDAMSSESGFAGSGGFPYQWGSVTTGSPPRAFPPTAGSTFGGMTDGIGVNGTVPTDPGSITVYEAGIRHAFTIGDNKLHWEMGALDPRTRFLQNAFADDENTQYLDNNFDDSPAIQWLTDASGRTVFGWHFWLDFGGNKQFRVNAGWFNTPGQWFTDGQFYIQISWKGEVNGRPMNVHLMGFVDEFFQDSARDGSAGGGASWDWMLTDKIGAWFRVGVNGDDVNPVENDFSLGVVFFGLIESRPDDVIGLGVGFVTANTNVQVGIPEDTEITIELYYRYVMEDGKLQITPHLIIVSDPGGNASPWEDDLLVILGIRIHVPF